MAAGVADLHTGMVARLVVSIDAGEPIRILAGIHAGCFELFGTDRVRSIKDLKGRTVAVPGLGSSHYLYVASIAAYVGLDAQNDITFVTPPIADSARLLAAGKIDAVVAFPPVSQELRASKIGHVVLDSRVDQPWSQYFCCMLTANREFVRRHPVATKRAMRAILKANDICALEPERVAQRLVDWGYVTRYEHAVQALKELPYAKWREYDAEDAVRFYALRLHEARVIKSTPQRIIVQGTDWRFLQELKRELKRGRADHDASAERQWSAAGPACLLLVSSRGRRSGHAQSPPGPKGSRGGNGSGAILHVRGCPGQQRI